MRVAPPTNRPISGRFGNLRFPGRLLGKSGFRDLVRESHVGGASEFPAPRLWAPQSRVLQGVSGGNAARKSTIRAGRREPRFQSTSAYESPRFRPEMPHVGCCSKPPKKKSNPPNKFGRGPGPFPPGPGPEGARKFWLRRQRLRYRKISPGRALPTGLRRRHSTLGYGSFNVP